MIDSTSSSTAKSPNDTDEASRKNLPLQSPKTSLLAEIPHFTSTKKESFGEPVLCEIEPPSDLETDKYEYEFSCFYNGHMHFVGLWDTSDVSACERMVHRPLKPEDITYSETGNGFITDSLGLKLTFTKHPYERSWSTHADIKAGVKLEKSKVHTASAADILAELNG